MVTPPQDTSVTDAVADGLFVNLIESRRAPGSISLGVGGGCVATTPERDSLLGEENEFLP